MHKIIGFATIAAILAGCTSQIDEDNPTGDPTDTGDDVIVIDVDPVDPTDPDDDPIEQDPIVVVVDGETLTIGGISSASFDGSDTGLRVLIPLDGSGGEQGYDFVRDLGDYKIFETQQGDFTRVFGAVAGQSPNGEVVAIAVLDGGQFNRFLGGATVIQDNYTTPDAGLVQYEGDYVGLVNIGVADGDGIEFPATGSVIDGRVIITADFDSTPLVEGGIFGRTLTIETAIPTIVNLESLALVQTSIGDTGLFAGRVETGELVGVGSYTGAFAGDEAAFIGGNIVIDGRGLKGLEPADSAIIDPIVVDQPGIIQEYGIFVLSPCVGGTC